MPGYMFKSRDEEIRQLRCHVGRLQNCVESHKNARIKFENENKQLRNTIEEQLAIISKKDEEIDELKRQRDVYKNMVFKPNVKNEENENNEELKLPEEIKNKRKKKRGAKIGHKGYGRKKPDHIDKTKKVYMHACPDCGTKIKRSKKINKHIVEDIPNLSDLKTETTCYETEEQWCTKCKKHVRAEVAEVIPGNMLGMNLIILVMILKYGAKTTWHNIIFILAIFFKIKISVGGLVHMMHQARGRLGGYYDKILNEIRKGTVKFADETTWRVDGINHWLWGFFNEKNAYYIVEESRGKSVPEKIFKDCYDDKHTIVHDDYGAYQKLLFNHQSCWSHLLRVSHDATVLPKASDEIKELHKYLSNLYDELSVIVDGPFIKKEREIYYEKYKKIIFDIINKQYKEKDTLKIQTRISNQKENLITAIIFENVPLTNNLSERCIRPFVITRKVSGGSRSKEGAKTHAVNMSIVQTIKMQKLNLFDTLKQYLSLDSLKN